MRRGHARREKGKLRAGGLPPNLPIREGIEPDEFLPCCCFPRRSLVDLPVAREGRRGGERKRLRPSSRYYLPPQKESPPSRQPRFRTKL